MSIKWLVLSQISKHVVEDAKIGAPPASFAPICKTPKIKTPLSSIPTTQRTLQY